MNGAAKTLLASWLCFGGMVGARADDTVPSKADYVRPREIPFPEDNPYSHAKAELGQRMFFDPTFSASKTLSCASCHIPQLGWTDSNPHARGDLGSTMSLRTPTLLNVAWLDRLGWDGKFRDLEVVAFTPITGKLNMNLPEPELVDRLKAVPSYVAQFDAAFGDPAISRKRIELALATYERTIVSPDAPFDRWIAGDETAIDAAAKHGFELFNGKGQCAQCHSGWSFTDGSYHDIGTATGQDIGRGRYFSTSVKLQYAFKTPSLRDVARHAPYMHTGDVATLEQVVDLYDKGGIDRPSRSEVIKPLHLTQAEKSDLLGFLHTLTSDTVAPSPPAPPTQ